MLQLITVMVILSRSDNKICHTQSDYLADNCRAIALTILGLTMLLYINLNQPSII